MPTRKSDKTSKPVVRKPAKHAAAQSKAATKLPESMVTGKASSAKAAVGDEPVFVYVGRQWLPWAQPLPTPVVVVVMDKPVGSETLIFDKPVRHAQR